MSHRGIQPRAHAARKMHPSYVIPARLRDRFGLFRAELAWGRIEQESSSRSKLGISFEQFRNVYLPVGMPRVTGAECPSQHLVFLHASPFGPNHLLKIPSISILEK